MANKKQKGLTEQQVDVLWFLREKALSYRNNAIRLGDVAHGRDKDILLGQRQAYNNMVGIINRILGLDY